MAVVRLTNKTGATSKVGYLVKIVSGGFEYASASDFPVGVVAQSAKNGKTCNIVTSGKAYVYVSNSVKVNDIIRQPSEGEGAPKGTCVPASDASTYTYIGKSLEKGKGLVTCIINISDIGEEQKSNNFTITSVVEGNNITTTTEVSEAPIDGELYGRKNGTWQLVPDSDSMVYPTGSGIPIVVTGTSWGTTITDNSSNWDTAYGWGDHSLAGYITNSYYTFSNGLTESTGSVLLGGTLTADVNFTGSFDFRIGTAASPVVVAQLQGSSYVQIGSETQTDIVYSTDLNTGIFYKSIQFNATHMNVFDNISSKGLEYGADYDTNGKLDNDWIPSWRAVKSQLGGNDLNSNLTAPTDDGYVVAWNTTNSEYELVANGSGGTSYWTQSGTSLSPATSGDDILLAVSTERILFGDGDSYIYESSDDEISIIAAGGGIYGFNSTGVTLGSLGKMLGSSSWYWDTLFVDDIQSSDSSTVDGRDLTIRAGNTLATGYDGGDLTLKAGNALSADSTSTAGSLYLSPGNPYTSSVSSTIYIGDSSYDSQFITIAPYGTQTNMYLQIRSKGSGDLRLQNGSTGDVIMYTDLEVQGGDITLGTTTADGELKASIGSTVGRNLSITAGSGNGSGNYDGGNLILSPGEKTGTGTRGELYIGDGTNTGPRSASTSYVLYYNPSTGEVTYN